MRRSKALRLFDFSGGLNTKASPQVIAQNQASDLQNINLLPNGGFEKRRGNSVFNSSALASGAAIHGLGYFRQSTGTENFLAIAGTTISNSASLSGTFSDVTGAVTITTGQDNIWTMSVMNDLAIFVGGAPDAPIKYSGAGNAAVLGGTPPNGAFGLEANNYFFIGNTSANPSRIAWSVLGDPADWAGTGSGTQDVSKNDGDTLVGACVLNISHMLLFKQNSIHDLIINNTPFPLFPKFRGVGAVSKRAIINVDNLAYFITPEPRMKATDGNQIFDFPDSIDDVWDGLSKSRLQYIHGQYVPRLRQIWWYCSNGTSSTHNYCIVWDLVRKAWLRNPQGYGMNVSALAQDRLPYAGAYDGKVYQQDKTSTYTDASESSAAISAFWRSGWLDIGADGVNKAIPYADLAFIAQSSGNLDFSYGFNFGADRHIVSVNMVAPGSKWNQFLWDVGSWGGQTQLIKKVFMKGQGQVLQFMVRNANNNEQLTFNGIEVPIKESAVAVMI